MLSSRYLYLHEALGLGPMWLNRDAKVLATPPAERTAAPVAAPKAPPASVAPAAETPREPLPAATRDHNTAVRPAAPANSARAAALAAVGSHIGAAEDKSQENQPAAKTTNETLPPAHDAAYFLEALAGRTTPPITSKPSRAASAPPN